MYRISSRLFERVPRPYDFGGHWTEPSDPKPKRKRRAPALPRESLADHLDEADNWQDDICRPSLSPTPKVLVAVRDYGSLMAEYNASARANGMEECPSSTSISRFCEDWAPRMIDKPFFIFGSAHPNFRGNITEVAEAQPLVPDRSHRVANHLVVVSTRDTKTDNGTELGTIVYLGVVCGPVRVNGGDNRVTIHETTSKNDLMMCLQPIECYDLTWQSLSPGGSYDDVFRWSNSTVPVPRPALRVFVRAPGLFQELSSDVRSDLLRLGRLEESVAFRHDLDTKPFKQTGSLRIAMLLDILMPDGVPTVTNPLVVKHPFSKMIELMRRQ